MRPRCPSWLGTCVLAAITVTAEPVSACIMPAEFVIEDVRHADLVFQGTLVRYQHVEGDRDKFVRGYGLVTVQVDKLLKGNASGELKLYWGNSTFGLPEKWERSDRLLIAAVRADRAALPLRAPSATVFASSRPDLPEILQAPCAAPFLLPATPDNVADVRTVLAGGSALERNYFAEGRDAVSDTALARLTSPLHIGFAFLLVFILSPAAILAFSLVRRRLARHEPPTRG